MTTTVVLGVVFGVDFAALLAVPLASANDCLTPTTCHTSNGGMS